MRNVQAMQITGPVVGFTKPIVWPKWVEAVNNMAQTESITISKQKMRTVLDELINCEPDDFREFAEALMDKVFNSAE